jgi:hypothetical protein
MPSTVPAAGDSRRGSGSGRREGYGANEATWLTDRVGEVEEI